MRINRIEAGTISASVVIRENHLGDGWDDYKAATADCARYIEASWRVSLLPYEQKGYFLDLDVNTYGSGDGRITVDVGILQDSEDSDAFEIKAEIEETLEQVLDDGMRAFMEGGGKGIYRVGDPKDASTLLLIAAHHRDIESVEILLERGADINEKDEYGRTPLHHAATIGNAEVIKILIDSGADTRAGDNDGDKPADYAEAKGRNDIASMLRSIDLMDKHGISNTSPRRGHEAAL